MTSGYRRAIRIVATAGRAVAEIEDDFHHFVVTVSHDGRAVTAAAGQAIRYPWSACPMAGGALGALEGLPLSVHPTGIYRFTDPRAQCTHMFEMAGLAVAQAARGEGERRYDGFVADPAKGAQIAELRCGGEAVLRWRLQDGLIVEPTSQAGVRPGDIRSRTLADLPPDEAEAQLILGRCVVLAVARAMDVDRFATAADMGRPSVCYVFNPDRAAGARRRLGSERDFSHGDGPLAAPARQPQPEDSRR